MGEQNVGVYRCMYTFNAETENDLQLNKGDIVKVTKQINSEWFHGSSCKAHGQFPKNYVELVFNEPVDRVGIVLNNFSAEQEQDLPLFKDELVAIEYDIDENWLQGFNKHGKGIFPVVFVREIQFYKALNNSDANNNNEQSNGDLKPVAKIIDDFQAQDSDELTIKSGEIVMLIREIDGFWMEGMLNNRKGKFPKMYVDIIKDLPSHLKYHEKKPEHKDLSPVPQARALFMFVGTEKDELSFDKGDTIQLTKRINKHWLVGTIGKSEGKFPANYVEVVVDLPFTMDSNDVSVSNQNYASQTVINHKQSTLKQTQPMSQQISTHSNQIYSKKQEQLPAKQIQPISSQKQMPSQQKNSSSQVVPSKQSISNQAQPPIKQPQPPRKQPQSFPRQTSFSKQKQIHSTLNQATMKQQQQSLPRNTSPPKQMQIHPTIKQTPISPVPSSKQIESKENSNIQPTRTKIVASSIPSASKSSVPSNVTNSTFYGNLNGTDSSKSSVPSNVANSTFYGNLNAADSSEMDEQTPSKLTPNVGSSPKYIERKAASFRTHRSSQNDTNMNKKPAIRTKPVFNATSAKTISPFRNNTDKPSTDQSSNQQDTLAEWNTTKLQNTSEDRNITKGQDNSKDQVASKERKPSFNKKRRSPSPQNFENVEGKIFDMYSKPTPKPQLRKSNSYDNRQPSSDDKPKLQKPSLFIEGKPKLPKPLAPTPAAKQQSERPVSLMLQPSSISTTPSSFSPSSPVSIVHSQSFSVSYNKQNRSFKSPTIPRSQTDTQISPANTKAAISKQRPKSLYFTSAHNGMPSPEKRSLTLNAVLQKV